MIRVFTLAGDKEFDDADGFTISTKTEALIGAIAGGLKVWKIDREGQNHKLRATFAPGGWLGFKFVNTDGRQIPEPPGFRPPKA